MCLDTHEELREAWRAINQAPEASRARALVVLQDLTAISYDRANNEIKRALGSRNKVDEIRMANELGTAFRTQYHRAAELARAGE